MTVEELKSPKTPEELEISGEEWVELAESYLMSLEISRGLPGSELGLYHQKRVEYLREFFGMKNDRSK